MRKNSGWQGIVSFNTGGAMTTLVMRAASISVLSLLLAGCAAPATEAPLAVEGLQACEATIESAVEDSIGAQVDAFGREDFSAAYDMAAPDFQSEVSLEEFEGVIRDGFVPLMNVASFSVSQCLYDPAKARVEISMTLVTASGVAGSLRYSLVSVPQGWRILGAVPNPQSQQAS